MRILAVRGKKMIEVEIKTSFVGAERYVLGANPENKHLARFWLTLRSADGENNNPRA